MEVEAEVAVKEEAEVGQVAVEVEKVELEVEVEEKVEEKVEVEVEVDVVVEAEEEVGLVAVVEEVWSAPSQAARG